MNLQKIFWVLRVLLYKPFLKIHGKDGGPVFYSQIRIGKDEKPFRIRSMVVNAEKLKKDLLEQNEVEGAMK